MSTERCPVSPGVAPCARRPSSWRPSWPRSPPARSFHPGPEPTIRTRDLPRPSPARPTRSRSSRPGGDYVHFSSTPPATVLGARLVAGQRQPGSQGESHRRPPGQGRRALAYGGDRPQRPSSRAAAAPARANARFTCVGTKKTTWRSVVDVDIIIGVADSPNKLETPAKTAPLRRRLMGQGTALGTGSAQDADDGDDGVDLTDDRRGPRGAA
ncbi:hypothetical protein ACRAWF_30735 [Streptomyces sp. L7]